MGYVDNAEFENTDDMLESVNSIVHNHVMNMRQVSANLLGLDSRCGRAWVNDFFVVCDDRNGFDYYGGFEYVDKDHVTLIGGFKFYSSQDSRVRDCLECLADHDEAEQEAELGN